MKIENRQKVLTIVAISAVALLALDRLILTPLGHVWAKRSERIAELSKDLTQGRLLLDREKRIRDRWSNMASNTLPVNLSMAESKVLKSVDHWTQDSGISFTSIKPQWKQNADDYVTLECRADAFGDMSSLTRFLYDLEREPLALRVEDVEITSRDNDGQQLSLGVRFTGLVLTGEPAQQP
jgi:Tfp pilus assembly protein PilO